MGLREMKVQPVMGFMYENSFTLCSDSISMNLG